MNASHRCLFLLGVALAATAPAYSQGHIVPDGVTYSTAGLSAVIHVMQSSANGDYTGFILRSRFFTPGSPYYTIFSFDPGAPDEGVRTFFTSQNDPVSLEPIQAGAYTELVLGNYYGFDPGVPFYLGFYTGHTNGAPAGAYSNPVFGWGEFVNNQGVIQMLDAALEVGGGGIYVGTQTIIPIPEPGILGLAACGALSLGWRYRRLNHGIQRMSASRSGHRQLSRQRRLALAADAERWPHRRVATPNDINGRIPMKEFVLLASLVCLTALVGCGGPPSSVVEQAIKEPIVFDGNTTLSYKIGNKYTRELGGEKIWVYEYDHARVKPAYEGFGWMSNREWSGKVELVKRGSKWYH